MEQHRSNAVCAACHARMDPIGFALENYDGVGKWRDEDSGMRIDASGRLPDGSEFNGPAGLTQLMVTKYREDFVRTVTEKLMTYALGPRRRVLRQPNRAGDRAAGGARQLSDVVADSFDCEKHTIPHEEGFGVMIITNKTLPRRTFLRGRGRRGGSARARFDVLAVDRASAQTMKKAPVRLGYVYTPNGIIGCSDKSPKKFMWTPTAAGANFAFSPTMKSLEPFRENVVVFSGLAQVTGRALGDGPGDHARATATWLTGVHPYKTGGADFKLGISADQIAAQEFGKQTQLASLELALEQPPLAGNCDSGYTCAYMSMSWRGETSPLPGEINPRMVFERLFGDGESTRADGAHGAAREPEERARLRDRAA